ncbi:MAG: hypothetical protein M3116_02635 [Actinomycetota bacterium]|nr:hypothetical protein [Actinomycetota bacterium]
MTRDVSQLPAAVEARAEKALQPVGHPVREVATPSPPVTFGPGPTAPAALSTSSGCAVPALDTRSSGVSTGHSPSAAAGDRALSGASDRRDAEWLPSAPSQPVPPISPPRLPLPLVPPAPVAPAAGVSVGSPGGGSAGHTEQLATDLAIVDAYGAAVLAQASARITAGVDERVIGGAHEPPSRPD